MTSYGWRGRALGGLHHAAERPAPARELPGDRAVGHHGPLARLVERLPAVDQPARALGGVPPDRGGHLLAPPERLHVARGVHVVPGGLDQEPPEVAVAGLRDPAAAAP